MLKNYWGMNLDRLIFTISNLTIPDSCDTCDTVGIQCRFNRLFKTRTIIFDHISQSTLPPGEHDCQIRNNPYLTEAEAEENAKSLRSLRDELNKITPNH